MVSEREIEAACDAIQTEIADWPDAYACEIASVALEAAARVRAEDNAEPVAWRYRYTDPLSGKPIWRYDNHLWNGQRPSERQALFAHPAPQPSGTVEVKPLADLIHDALAFAVWAAGEGLCPTDSPTAPEDFLYAYSTATGFEDWDAIPHHVATTFSAPTAGGGDAD